MTKPFIYRKQIIATGKYYIGKHNGKSTKIYKGSGKLWKQDYKIYVQDRQTDLIEEILEYVNDISKLHEREEYWLNLVDAKNNLLYYNLTNKCYGIEEHKQETKDKISKSNKGKIRSQENIINLSKPKTKLFKIANTKNIIMQYDLEGNFIKEWINIGEVCNKLNLKCSNSIWECCNRINLYASGFIWRFKGDEYIDLNIRRKGKIINQYDLKGTFIKSFNSLTEASISIQCTPNGISNVLRGKSKTIKNYIFKYENFA